MLICLHLQSIDVQCFGKIDREEVYLRETQMNGDL